MHYHNGKLYVVTHLGNLACLDVSDVAVAEAMAKAPSLAKARSLEQVAVTSAIPPVSLTTPQPFGADPSPNFTDTIRIGVIAAHDAAL